MLGVWFGPDLQLEINWWEVLEKVTIWTAFPKGRAEVCGSHIYLLALYRFSVLPIPCTILFKLERVLFQLIWTKREICYLHPPEGGLGVPNIKMRCHALRLSFLDRMCFETWSFRIFARLSFPLLRNVHSADRETHRLPRGKCPCLECQLTLKVFSRSQTGLFDSRP